VLELNKNYQKYFSLTKWMLKGPRRMP